MFIETKGLWKCVSGWIVLTLSVLVINLQAQNNSWQMKQRDQFHTGRADYVVPQARLNDTFFSVFLWQTPAPGSPDEGNLGGTSMSFFDPNSPDGPGLVLGAYHWPKGVQGMDRHTGEVFWYGNPDGGESIAEITPAFSSDGSAIYVKNDCTASGAVLMAFSSSEGPSFFWGNQNSPDPWHFEMGSPLICNNDGRIFSSAWCDRPYGAWDSGSEIVQVWAAPEFTESCISEPALWSNAQEGEMIIATGRRPFIRAFDDFENTLWSVNLPQGTDATASIDPASGNIYVAAGWENIYLAGLDIDGYPLWSETALELFHWEEGVNYRQRATAAGCISHDGATYYFQTVAEDGSGGLYAINTADGSVKWIYDTQSKGWEGTHSCPIVTPNGVIVVGNNENGVYYALQDNGQDDVVLLDTLAVVPDTENRLMARASATMSEDGLLYLPLRTTWRTGNGNGDMPAWQPANLFCAFDLSENASSLITPPGGQYAIAGNHQITLGWNSLANMGVDEIFSHYAIYRNIQPFDTVEGMDPIAQIYDINTTSYQDENADNGIAWYYAITAVNTDGKQATQVTRVGPRVPFDETDLQVVSINRSPDYPRYCPSYSWYEMTGPDGFGPYGFSAATGLECGQTAATKHYPQVGEIMTYTATVRNRGSNLWDSELTGQWYLDGSLVKEESQYVTLQPDDQATFIYELAWDNEFHDLQFVTIQDDARSGNNQLVSNTLAVGFLTFVDRSFIERFRDEWSPNWPERQTDDMIDWLNRHAARLNEMFAEAGSDKRVFYDVLEVLPDAAENPPVDTINWAIFPFRYRSGIDGDPRAPGYYRPQRDIDNGLLHEMAHQLGMIDIYQLDLSGQQNQVSGLGYSAVECLMNGCSDVISPHSALAMNHWLKTAHGYYGQYLYQIPETLTMRFLGFDGRPLKNATIKVYQYCERPGQGKVITDQVKFAGATDADGYFTLPNVPVDNNLIPSLPTGDALHANPFGNVAVVATNGVLHFKIEYNMGIDYCWLDITEANVAYWQGHQQQAVFERTLNIGGPFIKHPPRDLTENNAASWFGWADGVSQNNTFVTDDFTNKVRGASSLKFTTDGGFDTFVRFPKSFTALWNLTQASQMTISFYAENPSPYGFQGETPWIRLKDRNGYYFEYLYYHDGWAQTLLNDARGAWQSYAIPLNASTTENNGWRRTAYGSPDLSAIQYVEIHADTWDNGFSLWIDGVSFDMPEPVYNDLNDDGAVNSGDLQVLAENWLQAVEWPECLGADQDQDGRVTLADFQYLSQTWLE